MPEALISIFFFLLGVGFGTAVTLYFGSRYQAKLEAAWQERWDIEASRTDVMACAIAEACYCLDRGDVSNERIKRSLENSLTGQYANKERIT